MISSSPDTRFWTQLLSLMKKGQVIPIVGRDAIVLDDVPGRPTLNEYLARQTEVELGLSPTDMDMPVTLHDVASRYLEAVGSEEISTLYTVVNDVLSVAAKQLEIPETLRKLARINAFTLYVTTTFDDFLLHAIDAERFGGEQGTEQLVYAPERVDDLAGSVASLEAPTVYHLLGRASALQDYVVNEEDTLEFVHSLQSEFRRPHKLMDEFGKHHILLIGSGYSDWLMRFFIRIAKRDRLLLARSRTIVVDGRDDISLTRFLQRFSAQTRVFTNGAAGFVDELYERWTDFRETALDTVHRRAPEHPIFMSYASEDRPHAARLAGALRAAGIPVWIDRPVGYDEAGLQGGMEWQTEIAARIQKASVFTPVLSRRVQTQEHRYFRKEWDQAIEVGKGAPPNRHFIVPVCFDDLSPTAPEIPDRFRDFQWLGARDDAGFAEAVRRLRDIYREYLRRRGADRA
jgi:hypothetical protein